MHALPRPAVQLVTGAWTDPADLVRRVDAVLRGGIRWVQLRARHLGARELEAAAVLLAPRLREAGGLLVVNDRVDVALAAGAGGVHLPEQALSADDARRLAGPSAWVARSVHGLEAMSADAARGLDAWQFGPVFDTPSKRAFGEPQGLALLEVAATVAHAHGKALLAVGGITAERVAACRAAGADAVCVIGAVWDAPDVQAAARALVDAAG